jgi:hypothetical protein
MKQSCGTYVPVVYISSKQNLSKWTVFFPRLKQNFRSTIVFSYSIKFLKIKKNRENNQERIQLIYFHLSIESLLQSNDEQKHKQKTLYLLTENNQ